MRFLTGGSQRFSGVYLGKDTEADEVILGNANGVFKVRTVKEKTTISTMECRLRHEDGIFCRGSRREMEWNRLPLKCHLILE